VAVDRINLNDRTVEGMRHKSKPIFCVQYHPEASPGPHDSTPLFAEFRRMIGKSVIMTRYLPQEKVNENGLTCGLASHNHQRPNYGKTCNSQ
jgi:hypothetical protein